MTLITTTTDITRLHDSTSHSMAIVSRRHPCQACDGRRTSAACSANSEMPITYAARPSPSHAAREHLLDEHGHQTGKEMLVREVSMLIKLAQSLEDKPSDS